MSEQPKQEALARAAARLGDAGGPGDAARPGDADGRGTARQVLEQIWDLAFEHGRLAALDELSDRFCVCMK